MKGLEMSDYVTLVHNGMSYLFDSDDKFIHSAGSSVRVSDYDIEVIVKDVTYITTQYLENRTILPYRIADRLNILTERVNNNPVKLIMAYLYESTEDWVDDFMNGDMVKTHQTGQGVAKSSEPSKLPKLSSIVFRFEDCPESEWLKYTGDVSPMFARAMNHLGGKGQKLLITLAFSEDRTIPDALLTFEYIILRDLIHRSVEELREWDGLEPGVIRDVLHAYHILNLLDPMLMDNSSELIEFILEHD